MTTPPKNPSFAYIASAISLVKAIQYVFATESAVAHNFGAESSSNDAAKAQTLWLVKILGLFYFALSGWHCEAGYDKAKAMFWTFSGLFASYYAFLAGEDAIPGAKPAIVKFNALLCILLAIGFWSRVPRSLSLENIVSTTFFMNFVLFTFYTEFSLGLYFPGVETSARVLFLVKVLGVANFSQAGLACQPGYDKVKAIMCTAYGLFFAHYAFVMPGDSESMGISSLLTPWMFIMLFWASCYWQRVGGVDINVVTRWVHLLNFVLFTWFSCFACKMYFPDAKLDDAAKSQLKWSFKCHGMLNLGMSLIAASPGYDEVKFITYAAASVLFGNYVFHDGGARLERMGSNRDLVLFWTILTAYFANHYWKTVSSKGDNNYGLHAVFFAILIGAMANQA